MTKKAPETINLPSRGGEVVVKRREGQWVLVQVKDGYLIVHAPAELEPSAIPEFWTPGAERQERDHEFRLGYKPGLKTLGLIAEAWPSLDREKPELLRLRDWLIATRG